ncbi:MAG: glycosyltransferase family 9 protein [Acidobacteriota bacterium]|nr:glycosyltransferase family 9 protein [Acidobacteriota bacterium]
MSARMVLFQLERMGDLAQTLPALEGLVRGGVETRLVVRRHLLGLARLLAPEAVECVAVADVSLLEVEKACRRGDPAARTMAAELAAPLARPGDLVVNLSYHQAGALLATAAAGEAAWGPWVSAAGERLIRGVWATYLLAAVDARPAGRVHMTDLRRLVCAEALGRELPVWKPMTASRPGTGGLRVGLVTGAGDPARRSSARWLQTLAQMLVDAGYRLVLLGGEEDRSRADTLARGLTTPPRNRVGTTTLEEVVGEVRRLDLVVGFDTGPVHLASACGTPVVMVLGGGAHYWETGPWGEGDLALQALEVGRAEVDGVPPSVVVAACRARLEGLGCPDSGAGYRVLRVEPAPPSDRLGGIVYGHRGRVAAALAQRRLLAAFGAPPADHPEGAECAAGQAARQGCRQAAQALEALGSGDPRQAAGHLQALAASIEDLLEKTRGEAETRLIGAWVAALLEHLPPSAPDQTARVCGRILRRALSALGAASPALAHDRI